MRLRCLQLSANTPSLRWPVVPFSPMTGLTLQRDTEQDIFCTHSRLPVLSPDRAKEAPANMADMPGALLAQELPC